MATPKVKYFITVDLAHLDSKNQKLSAKGFFDRFRISIFPSKAPQFFLVLGITDIKGSVNIVLQINKPNGEIHSMIETRFQAKSPLDTVNRIIKMDGLPLPERGIYTFKVILKEDQSLLAEHILIADYPPKREFSPEEIQRILTDPMMIKDSKVKVQCNKCGQMFHFELRLDPNQPTTPGFLPFPPNNKLNCCGELDLTGLRREIEWNFGKSVQKEEPPKRKPTFLN